MSEYKEYFNRANEYEYIKSSDLKTELENTHKLLDRMRSELNEYGSMSIGASIVMDTYLNKFK